MSSVLFSSLSFIAFGFFLGFALNQLNLIKRYKAMTPVATNPFIVFFIVSLLTIASHTLFIFNYTLIEGHPFSLDLPIRALWNFLFAAGFTFGYITR